MSLIKRHEAGARGVYCGAIGYLGPGGKAVFNVPIRTLTLGLPDEASAKTGGGQAVYPIGSGLVSDSDAAVEYRECLDKARVLQRATAPAFEIFETMLYRASEQSVWLLDRHLVRLADSADYFDYPYTPGRVHEALASEGLSHGGTGARGEDLRVRLLLAADGSVQVQTTPIAESVIALPRRVTLGGSPVDTQDVFLYHKTTNRLVYEDALSAAPGADDVLLVNERGELTESCYGNIALKIDGEWLTPPISCGLLAGTLRAELLAAGELREAVLTPADLQRAEAIELLNSVRGRMPAVLQ
jgi:para-aminobenzoate synthetase/4-amino-4-deoxychorismate lyase